ncbi:hypothetical protein R0K30_03690 [Bacillus sp. SIMBA_154]|uniref:hypothetical protein n=1 Tax=Bacillus sp. SIMBA_154 TaxID=3080859 RepID=UPI003978D963
MKTYQTISLDDYVNNRGITHQNEYDKGQLTIGGASLPAELVMNLQHHLVEGIPFQFIYKDQGDNIELEGQSIHLPLLEAEALHVIGCSSNGNLYENISFLREGKVVYESRLSLTDVIEQEPAFNDRAAYAFDYIHTVAGINHHLTSRLWLNSLSLSHKVVFDEIRFQDNPFMHIFAMTIQQSDN